MAARAQHASDIQYYTSLEAAAAFGDLVWGTAVQLRADQAQELGSSVMAPPGFGSWWTITSRRRCKLWMGITPVNICIQWPKACLRPQTSKTPGWPPCRNCCGLAKWKRSFKPVARGVGPGGFTGSKVDHLLCQQRPPHALCGFPPPALFHRQWHGGEWVQTNYCDASETFRRNLVSFRCCRDRQSAGSLAQRGLGYPNYFTTGGLILQKMTAPGKATTSVIPIYISPQRIWRNSARCTSTVVNTMEYRLFQRSGCMIRCKSTRKKPGQYAWVATGVTMVMDTSGGPFVQETTVTTWPGGMAVNRSSCWMTWI